MTLLLPDCPEIGSTINYNEELASVEKGIHSVKGDILSTHNELEEAFNNYGDDDEEDQISSSKEEVSLQSDISRLLNSNFFNKKKNQEEEVEDI